MRKATKMLLTSTVLLGFAAFALASGTTSTESTNSSKIGEVETTETEKQSTEKETTAKETETEKEVSEQTEFYVGDTLTTQNLEITFLSSGDYAEDNQYMQPDDGMKYIFINLFVKNISSSDTSISYFDFEGFADGYAVDQYYGADNELSASLSPDRTASGMVLFTVPVDAQEIEIEYEVNLWTDQKVKFIFEGDKESGIVPEINGSASEGAYAVGDIITTKEVNITYADCGEYVSDNQFIQPDEGNHYIYIELEFENVSDSDQYISSLSFDCFADGVSCDQVYLTDEDLSATLSAGRKTKGKIIFEVPSDAAVVEVEYVDNYWTSDRIVFTVK